MRMWGIEPRSMCRRHLLGEHVEMHMFAGCIKKNKNIDGYLDGLVVPANIKIRHDELAREMLRRGYKHVSPFLPLASISNYLDKHSKMAWIDIEENKKELKQRCSECALRMETL